MFFNITGETNKIGFRLFPSVHLFPSAHLKRLCLIVYHKLGISVSNLTVSRCARYQMSLHITNWVTAMFPISRPTNIATCQSSSLTIPGSSSFVSSSLSTYSHLGQCHCDAIPFVFTSLLSQLQVFKITLSIFNCQSKCRESANLAKEFQWLSF